MFGHDNSHHDNNDHQTSEADLMQDDQQVTKPQADDSGLGDYLDEAEQTTPGAPAAVQPDASGVSLPNPDATPVADSAGNGAAAPVANDSLLQIKQDALQQLTPLVGHLEQSPEEKFRTTMMMIQASDNHELIQTAYEAAKQITNEKTRAQALLDIVNEINYFTQNNAGPEA